MTGEWGGEGAGPELKGERMEEWVGEWVGESYRDAAAEEDRKEGGVDTIRMSVSCEPLPDPAPPSPDDRRFEGDNRKLWDVPVPAPHELLRECCDCDCDAKGDAASWRLRSEWLKASVLLPCSQLPYCVKCVFSSSLPAVPTRRICR